MVDAPDKMPVELRHIFGAAIHRVVVRGGDKIDQIKVWQKSFKDVGVGMVGTIWQVTKRLCLVSRLKLC